MQEVLQSLKLEEVCLSRAAEATRMAAANKFAPDMPPGAGSLAILQ